MVITTFLVSPLNTVALTQTAAPAVAPVRGGAAAFADGETREIAAPPSVRGAGTHLVEELLSVGGVPSADVPPVGLPSAGDGGMRSAEEDSLSVEREVSLPEETSAADTPLITEELPIETLLLPDGESPDNNPPDTNPQDNREHTVPNNNGETANTQAAPTTAFTVRIRQDAANDTGSSQSDNITNNRRPALRTVQSSAYGPPAGDGNDIVHMLLKQGNCPASAPTAQSYNALVSAGWTIQTNGAALLAGSTQTITNHTLHPASLHLGSTTGSTTYCVLGFYATTWSKSGNSISTGTYGMQKIIIDTAATTPSVSISAAAGTAAPVVAITNLESNSKVRLYTSTDCTTGALGSGDTSVGASATAVSITLSGRSSGDTFYAKHTDIAGNTACSNGVGNVPSFVLDLTSDTGSDTTDDLTNDTTPEFTITDENAYGGAANNEVRIYYKNTTCGTRPTVAAIDDLTGWTLYKTTATTASVTSTTGITSGTALTTTGNHCFLAFYSPDGSAVTTSSYGQLDVVIDPTAPIVISRVAPSLLSGAPIRFSDDGDVEVVLDSEDRFGFSTAFSADGSLLAAGAAYDDDGGSNSGAVHLFQKSSGAWQKIHKFSDHISGGTETERFTTAATDINLAAGDGFGGGVSLSADGTLLAVGAFFDSDGGTRKGAVYLFKKQSDGKWSKILTISDNGGDDDGEVDINLTANDRFGSAVSLSADGAALAVGTFGKNSSKGAVHLFQYSDGSWSEIHEFSDHISGGTETERFTTTATDINLAAGDNFGSGVSFSADGTLLAVGAHNDDDGKRVDNIGNKGAVYLFKKQSDGKWQQVHKFSDHTTVTGVSTRFTATKTDVDLDTSDNFGSAVSLSADGNVLTVGAWLADSTISGADQGAVYLFQKTGNVWTQTLKIFRNSGGAGLLNINLNGSDYFGYAASLSADGTALAVGAAGDDGGSRESDGGAVYVFTITPTSTNSAMVTATDSKSGDSTLKYNTITGTACSAAQFVGGTGTAYTEGEAATVDSETDTGKRLCFRSKDTAGNLGYGISAPLNIDTTAPSLTVSKLGTGANATYAVTATDSSLPLTGRTKDNVTLGNCTDSTDTTGDSWSDYTPGTDTGTADDTNGRCVIITDGAGNSKAQYLSDSSSFSTSPPATPAGLIGVWSASAVTLRWSNSSDGAITKYQYQQCDSTGTVCGLWADIRSSGPTTISHNITGLSATTAYTLKLRAVNANGNSAAASTAGTTGTVYDTDRDGLIDINTIQKLNAVRWDLNGDGTPASGQGTNYNAVFSSAATNLGCPGPCAGYELMQNLDFNTGNAVRTDDVYYNGGSGWNPIGRDTAGNRFTGTFNGNGFVIDNLFINRGSTNDVGLFGAVGSDGVVTRLYLRDADITGGTNTGILAGKNSGTITLILSKGTVTGGYGTGGLVGYNTGKVEASYSGATVTGSGSAVGGLVGRNEGSTATVKNSYAYGVVSTTGSSTAQVGGLVGRNRTNATITASYYNSTNTAHDGEGGDVGKTETQLKTPTAYTGIYRSWNNSDIDGDGDNDAPWIFGTSTTYPGISIFFENVEVGFEGATTITRNENAGTVSVCVHMKNPLDYEPMNTRKFKIFVNTGKSGDTATTADYTRITNHPLGFFNATTRRHCFSVQILDDDIHELDEEFTVTLAKRGPQGPSQIEALISHITVTVPELTLRIVSDDGFQGFDIVPTQDTGSDTTNKVTDTLDTVTAVLPTGATPTAAGVLKVFSYDTESDDSCASPTGSNTGWTAHGTRTGITGAGVWDASTRRWKSAVLDPVVGKVTRCFTVKYDLDGAGTVHSESAYSPVSKITHNIDYDDNDNGLIEIDTIQKLNAMRWDLNGDGTPASGQEINYTTAFPNAVDGMGCKLTDHDSDINTPQQETCTGYELIADLDLDDETAGDRTDDTYSNGGAGWAPIGADTTNNRFTATFNGNGFVIDNLLINRSSTTVQALFASTETGANITGVGLRDVSVTGADGSAALVGSSKAGTVIKTSFSTGTITGAWATGGLVGWNGGAVEASYSSAAVHGSSAVGGLVGHSTGSGASVKNSYATGAITQSGTTHLGGLIGENAGGASIAHSYWDTTITAAAGTGTTGATGKTTAQLTSPTGYASTAANSGTAIYNPWDDRNIDGISGNDAPWNFGSAGHYPALTFGGHRLSTQWPSAGNLSNLTTSAGTLTPVFNAYTYIYTAEVPATTASVTVTPTADTIGTAITVNGATVSSGAASAAITLTAGETTAIPVIVTPSSGTPHTYTLNVARLKDYDDDNDGLIDIRTHQQLNAIRWDLDGNGTPASGKEGDYAAAFPHASTGMGCKPVATVPTCTGYELRADIDLDTNGNGHTWTGTEASPTGDSGDAYHNSGAGWAPIGHQPSAAFHTTFKGNGHTISNLFINRTATYTGLFGFTGRPSNSHTRIEGVGLKNAYVKGGGTTGALVGRNEKPVTASWVTGAVRGTNGVGGLIGLNSGTTVTASYSLASVTATNTVGGLIGQQENGGIIASYAGGKVTASGSAKGGLVAAKSGTASATDAFYNSDTTTLSASALGTAKTDAELRTPAGYADIYVSWNVDIDNADTDDDLTTNTDDPWHITAGTYPVLKYGAGASTAEQIAEQIPAAPAGISAAKGNAEVTVSWSNPNNTTITKYQYQQKSGSGSYGSWTDISGSDASTITHTFDSLTNGTPYQYNIRAVNVAGSSVGAETAAVTPATNISAAPASVTLALDTNDNIAPYTTSGTHRTRDTTPTISFTAVSGATTTAKYRRGISTAFSATGITLTGTGTVTGRTVLLPVISHNDTYQVEITQTDGSNTARTIIYTFIFDNEAPTVSAVVTKTGAVTSGGVDYLSARDIITVSFTFNEDMAATNLTGKFVNDGVDIPSSGSTHHTITVARVDAVTQTLKLAVRHQGPDVASGDLKYHLTNGTALTDLAGNTLGAQTAAAIASTVIDTTVPVLSPTKVGTGAGASYKVAATDASPPFTGRTKDSVVIGSCTDRTIPDNSWIAYTPGANTGTADDTAGRCVIITDIAGNSKAGTSPTATTTSRPTSPWTSPVTARSAPTMPSPTTSMKCFKAQEPNGRQAMTPFLTGGDSAQIVWNRLQQSDSVRDFSGNGSTDQIDAIIHYIYEVFKDQEPNGRQAMTPFLTGAGARTGTAVFTLLNGYAGR